MPADVEVPIWGKGRLIVPKGSVGLPGDLWRTGCYEELVTEIMLALAPASVVYDVGANVGYYTALAALAGSKAVYAFEPYSPNFEHLRRNVYLNGIGQARLFPVALRETGGMLELHSGGSFGPGSVSATTAVSEDVVAQVPVEALDELAEKESLADPDILKIDIEGCEPFALRGMRRLLTWAKPICLFEVNERLLNAAGSSPGELVDLMKEIGYERFWDVGGKRLRPVGRAEAFMALAIPEERAGQVAKPLMRFGWNER